MNRPDTAASSSITTHAGSSVATPMPAAGTNSVGNHRLELYHHGSSVCAAKVRFALAEKELGWKGHYVDILSGENYRDEYRRIHPKALVPALVHDGRILTESTLICEYLEECFPDRPLYPRDPYSRHLARLWTKAVDEELHPACGAVTFAVSHRFTMMKLGPEKVEEFLSSTPDDSVTPDWRKRRRLWVEQGLDAPDIPAKLMLYDRQLSKMEASLRRHEWLAGSEFTVADISVAPYVNRLAMIGMSPMWANGRLPHVEAWFGRLHDRPTFRSAVIEPIPRSLTDDMIRNGKRSWPAAARILGLT